MDLNESNERIQSPFEVQGVLTGLRAPLEPDLILILGRLLCRLNAESREKEEAEAETMSLSMRTWWHMVATEGWVQSGRGLV